MGRNTSCSFAIHHLLFAIHPFSIRSFLIRLFFILSSLFCPCALPVAAQGDDPPTLTLTPTLTPTLTLTPAVAPPLTLASSTTLTSSPTRVPLRPDVEPFDGSLILENPLLWGLARRMLAGLGVANIRDYLAVVFALMGIARLIAKPPTVPE